MDSDGDMRAVYEAMEETSLLRVARNYDELTDVAQAALRAEFARRGLEAPLLDEGEELTSASLVTVARYRDLSEAIVARSLLEASGIRVSLRDENLVRLDWQISNFIGGLRLQVEATEEAVARELLSQPVGNGIDYGGDAAYVQPHCPVCGSAEITFEGASRGAALASLYVLAVPLPTGTGNLAMRGLWGALGGWRVRSGALGGAVRRPLPAGMAGGERGRFEGRTIAWRAPVRRIP